MWIWNVFAEASMVTHRLRVPMLDMGVSSTNEVDVMFSPGMTVTEVWRAVIVALAGRWRYRVR